MKLLGESVLLGGELMRIWFWFDCFSMCFRRKFSHEVFLVDFPIVFGLLEILLIGPLENLASLSLKEMVMKVAMTSLGFFL